MLMTQPLVRIEYAEREVVRYKQDVEGWKERYNEFARGRGLWEDLIAKANFLLDRLLSLFADITEIALKGDCRLAEELRARNLHVLLEWRDVTLQVLAEARRGELDYGQVAGLDVLRANNERAAEKLNLVREVHIDEGGRIFEMSGEQLIASGLAPEDVLRSLEDERLGRTRSLREIIAERVGNGI